MVGGVQIQIGYVLLSQYLLKTQENHLFLPEAAKVETSTVERNKNLVWSTPLVSIKLRYIVCAPEKHETSTI